METISNDKGTEIFRQILMEPRGRYLVVLMKQRTSHSKHCTHFSNFFAWEFLKTVDAFDLSLRQELNSDLKVLLARSLQKKPWWILSWSTVPEPGNFSSPLKLCKHEVGNSKVSTSKLDFLKTRTWESAHRGHNRAGIHTVSSALNQPRKLLLCFLPFLI